MTTPKSYIAVDLKSYYASCECADRHLDPLTTNLVVADLSRTNGTICLAVSPSLKALGVSGRPRLFEVEQKVKEINRDRLKAYQRLNNNDSLSFSSSSYDATALQSDPSLELTYIVAPPRMKHYMKVSSKIQGIYLKYVAPEDILVYSIDEVFMDVTPYLNTYKMTARELAMTIIREVLYTTGITATAGIGTNLYLAKVAMDIVAKHVEADKDGVRIAELDEESYRRKLWEHKPLTDFWRIGPGTARVLEYNNMFTVGDIARMSVTDKPVQVKIMKPRKGESNIQVVQDGEELLFKLFGSEAELLINHAWGYEPCDIRDVQTYSPGSRSMGRGQMLKGPYEYDKARVILIEMADSMALDMVERGQVCPELVVSIEYDASSLVSDGTQIKYKTTGQIYEGTVTKDKYGRLVPARVRGSYKFDNCYRKHTSSSSEIIKGALSIYEDKVDKDLLIRHIQVSAMDIIMERELKEKPDYTQMDLFTDDAAVEREKEEQKKTAEKEKSLQTAVLNIKEKFGKNAVLRGLSLTEGATARERNMQVGGHRGGEEDEIGNAHIDSDTADEKMDDNGGNWL